MVSHFRLTAVLLLGIALAACGGGGGGSGVTEAVPTAPAGSLDAAFNITGTLTTAIGAAEDTAYAVAVQGDGKIVAAGTAFGGTRLVFAVVRYNTDGSLDPSFNFLGAAPGIVTTPVGTGDAVARAVAIQTDGKIIVAGYAVNGANKDFAVVRYRSDGSLDLDFNNGGSTPGIVTTAIGGGDDVAQAVVIQPDGNIVVAGTSRGVTDDFAVVRYDANGALDSLFSGDGKVTIAVGAGADVGQAVALQSDGKIVVAGTSFNGSKNDFALVRLDTSGDLDPTFNSLVTPGIVSAGVGTVSDSASAMVVDPDDKIILAGASSDGAGGYFTVMRFERDGAADLTFNTEAFENNLAPAGVVTTDISVGNDDVPQAVRVGGDGRIVVAGNSFNGTRNEYVLARYGANGVLDTAFNATGLIPGVLTTAIGATDDRAHGVAIQPDGKIVAAGSSSNGSNNDLALARYWP